MGYATIVGGGADGRYTIELDFGEAQRVALIEAINNALVFVDEKIVEAEAKVAVADAAEAAQLVLVNAAAAALTVEANALPPGSPFPDTGVYEFELAQFIKIQEAGRPRRIILKTLKQNKRNLIAKRSQYTRLVVVDEREAWCCDLTEDGSGVVATVDIPGESDLILIAPSCRPWVANDGYFRERDLMSPEQCYYNAAVLPTWQKYKPTYRWGTITFIDEDANIVDVTLGEAKSSANTAPRIDVNQSVVLNGVPVNYMVCDARAFSVGDSCVVQFTGQNWEQPVVIGFLDNPQECPSDIRYRVSRSVYTLPDIINGTDNTTPPAGFDASQGVLYYIATVGYMASTSNLDDGDAYPGATFPITGRHYRVQCSTIVQSIPPGTTNHDGLVAPGGVIAGANVAMGATYIYFPDTYHSNGAGAGGATVLSFGDPIDNDPPTLYHRAFRIFVDRTLIAGEYQSGAYTSSTEAEEWVPASQTYRFTYSGSVVMDVTFTYAGGGIGGGAPSDWTISGWSRVA